MAGLALTPRNVNSFCEEGAQDRWEGGEEPASTLSWTISLSEVPLAWPCALLVLCVNIHYRDELLWSMERASEDTHVVPNHPQRQLLRSLK